MTLDEASEILGCSRSSVRRVIAAGRLASHGGRYEHRVLSQGEVEELAREVYPWRKHLHDEASWWVTGADAAAVYGCCESRLRELAASDRVPFVEHVDGVRLYRRTQLEVLARRLP